jgi:hypothetical protein
MGFLRLTPDNHIIHVVSIVGIPPFTIPRADGTLEADIQENSSGTATTRMMRRRQNEIARSDQDGDGHHTNLQGYRDGNETKGHDRGLVGNLHSDLPKKKTLLQKIRRVAITNSIAALLGWHFDVVGVLIYRNDPRIKGYVLILSTKQTTISTRAEVADHLT